MSTHTAVITGSTAGLGSAFARQLAAQGYGLVLVARDGDRLRDQAQRLNRRYGVPVSVIVADLVTDDGVGAVQERLADSVNPVHLLVNNAGHGLASDFVESDLEDQRRLLRLHVQTTMELTHTASRTMVRRRTGRVINVASVAGFSPTSTYSAAKSWVINFSRALHQQLRGDGVTVTALCPGLVRTEFHERSGITIKGAKKWMWLSADDVVRQGLAANAQGSALYIPSRSYQVLSASLRFMPDSMVQWAVNRRMGEPGQDEDAGAPWESPQPAAERRPAMRHTPRPAPAPLPRPKIGDDPDDDGTAEPTTDAIRAVDGYKAAKVQPQMREEPEPDTDEITTVIPGHGHSAALTGEADPSEVSEHSESSEHGEKAGVAPEPENDRETGDEPEREEAQGSEDEQTEPASEDDQEAETGAVQTVPSARKKGKNPLNK